ncbi:MFS monosaccharide transporter [Multifurca ochricompacta]|uniref:MFS monosaccharide transporter n=1 Tax=Multifurca ochricompacta TaxID=376703 RepID=A0AAD4LZA3_9AGAM|nr:MFS monosaccharide transporter [Multifurca ochricompacta]
MPGGPVSAGGGVGANAPKSKLAGILMTCFAAFGGILFGYDTGTISGIQQMPDWLHTFGHSVPVSKSFPGGYGISSSQRSLVVSILSAGTFFGALLAAPFADILGRKRGIIASCLVFSIGVALQTAATRIALFVVGRVFAGLGVGLVSTLVPMYQSECSPKWIRGAVVSLYQFAITVGILLSNIFNNATKNRPNHSSYRIPIAIQFVWAAVLAGGMLFLPESPRWLIKNRRDADAAQALGRLTSLPPNDPEVTVELEEIRLNLKHEEELGETSYLDCFRSSDNRIRFRTLSGIFIQAWQQLTGINFIFYFGTTFFTNAGIHNPFLISIATSTVNVGMTIPGIWGVERFGRRRLLIVGAVGMTICEFIIAIIGSTTKLTNQSAQSAEVALVCFYIAFFASTWGPIAWVVTGEIFPLNIRAKAMSLSVASNWLWNFGISYATPYLVDAGPGNADLGTKVFYIWGSTCFCCIIFAYFCIPETKGLSLEQIDLLYQNVAPINSVSYRKRLLAEGGELSEANPTAVKDDDLASNEKV